jgi:hypothetical protein
VERGEEEENTYGREYGEKKWYRMHEMSGITARTHPSCGTSQLRQLAL